MFDERYEEDYFWSGLCEACQNRAKSNLRTQTLLLLERIDKIGNTIKGEQK